MAAAVTMPRSSLAPFPELEGLAARPFSAPPPLDGDDEALGELQRRQIEDLLKGASSLRLDAEGLDRASSSDYWARARRAGDAIQRPASTIDGRALTADDDRTRETLESLSASIAALSAKTTFDDEEPGLRRTPPPRIPTPEAPRPPSPPRSSGIGQSIGAQQPQYQRQSFYPAGAYAPADYGRAMVVPVVAEDGRVYYRPADPYGGAHYAPPPPTHHVAPPQMYPAPYAGSPPFYGSPPTYGTPPYGYYAAAPPLASSPPLYVQPQPQQQPQQRRSPSNRRKSSPENPLPIFPAADLKGRVASLCRDQHGSRFLQAHLEDPKGDSAERDLIFAEVLPRSRELATDVFGNYVVQKVLARGAAEAKRAVFRQLDQHAVELGTHVYGCRVVQKALEMLAPGDGASLVEELRKDALRCVHDQHGNHVIQKCVEVTARAAYEETTDADVKKLATLGEQLLGEFATRARSLAAHPFGCRVLQRVLEHWGRALRDPAMRGHKAVARLVDELVNGGRDVAPLLEHQYANYVMQHCIQFGRPQDRSATIREVKNHLVDFSRHKFASNVVEKCLEFGDDSDRKDLVARVVGDAAAPQNLKLLLVDPFANYVVQKVVDLADRDQVMTIAAALRPVAAQVRHTPGKHIITRLEKKVPGLKL